MSDEDVVRSLQDDGLAPFSAEQRAALDRVLARLAAAERVCGLIAVSLARRRRTEEKGKQVYWWDVAIAVKEWEKLAKR